MALNLLFFAPTNVVGFVMWRRHLAEGSVEMRSLGRVPRLLVALACVVLIAVLGYALSYIKTQNIPYFDAASTILSIVATLLMMWRYKEQWILYIVLNAVTIAMWLIRLVQGSNDGSMMVIMWTAFLVNSIYGYVNWHRGSRRAGQPGESH
jgi:nicotinamide mononucleotide transporter